MPTFYEKEGFSIFGEMLRQEFAPCAIQAQRILVGEEKAAQGDVGVAIASSSVSLACSAGILALSGFTVPLFVSVGVLGCSIWQAWNSRVSQAEREKELLFLREHGSMLESIIQERLQTGSQPTDLANVYEVCLDAFECSRNPLAALGGDLTPHQAEHVVSSIAAPHHWTDDLMSYPSILIYGPQGAGKTATAAWLIGERINQGHQIKVLDPHREYGQWDGLECIGDGMDYEAINDELGKFTEEIKQRYKTRSKIPNYNPPKLTLVCDEFTQWAKKCGNSATFFEEALTDIRKVNLHVLFVSHARTLTGLGGSSGLAATRDAGLLELELEAQVDSVTKKASPKLLGWLKHPGVAMNERKRVAIASWMNGSMDFSDTAKLSTVPAVNTGIQLEQKAIINSQETITELKVSDSLAEPLKTIWLHAKERADWVSVREIQQKSLAVLKGKNSKEIHQLLGLLADSGYGEIQEEGRSDSAVVFRAC